MWARIIVALNGIWLMVAPAVLGYGGAAATSDRIAGPVAASIAIVAMSHVMRPLRRVNTLVGIWIALAPLLLDHAGAATVNAVVVGASIIALSLFGPDYKDEFGGGWSSLWKEE